VTWDGLELLDVDLSSHISGVTHYGPGRLGLWTWDNDGGIYYEDISVTNP
jgi:hypothetical protein